MSGIESVNGVISSNLRDCERSRGRPCLHAPTLGNTCHVLGGCIARIRVSRGLRVQQSPLMKELPSVERRCPSALPLPHNTSDRYCMDGAQLPSVAFIIHGRPNWDHVSHALTLPQVNHCMHNPYVVWNLIKRFQAT